MILKNGILKTRGIELSYTERGVGTPLVFISGFTTDKSVWDGVADRFAETGNYKVITFDNRGVGKSSVPEAEFSIETMADDVAELIRQRANGQALVVGQSMGGAIAQTLGYLHPSLVSKLVIANSFPFLNAAFSLFCELQLEMLRNSVARHLIDQLAIPWVFSNNFLANPSVVAQLKEISRANLSPQSLLGFGNQWSALRVFNSEGWLSKITVPTKIVAGEMDIISFVSESKAIAEKIPGATLSIINGVGHASQIEKPDEFFQVLNDFFAEGN